MNNFISGLDFLHKKSNLHRGTQVKCGRCLGRGRISKYLHVENGICFLCRGRKTTNFINNLKKEREYIQHTQESQMNNIFQEKKPYVSNHSGYHYEGSENFEHDDSGCAMNYSGCVDDIYQAIMEHEDWQEGYDY